MSTRSRPPTDIYAAGEGADFGEDDPTVIDAGEITPVEIPRCSDCGSVVFYDSFSEPAAAVASGLFAGRQCMRARDSHWTYCANYSPTHGKFVYLVPR